MIYLESLEDIARTGRRVIFYDQLGAGNSDRPSNPEMWTGELFLDELRTVREALALDRIHLFGSSWGGMLAMELRADQTDASMLSSRASASRAAVGRSGGRGRV
jgi:proline-specific peptidase